VPKGHAKPRVAPPVPLKHEAAEYRAFAHDVGIELYPWQETAAKYLTAKAPGGRWLYREVAIIVARQNGKTTLLVPLIMQRLMAGQSVMHTAQNAKLPREIHEEVATLFEKHFPDQLPWKRAISYAVGHEEIRLTNGGRYRIVAPTKSGARGPSNDLVIVDELREMVDHGFIGAAKPTLTASATPQMVYLSNAGTEGSAVLNSLRLRAASDPVLAYMEWSAAPERSADDVQGWAEANPRLGHDAGEVLETLHTEYRSHQIAGTLGIFETEHLCRWVNSIRRRLVQEFAWVDCAATELEPATRFSLGVSMDPEGKRATIVRAWRQKDDTIALQLAAQVSGEPFSVDAFGEELRKLAVGATGVAFDPLTDKALVRFVRKPKPEPVSGGLFSNASAQFTNLVNAGLIRWRDADAVTDDLGWTARKDEGDEGAYQAVRSDDEHPITAALAAIRAVWLASKAKAPAARVWT
jgi:hypothetical protein